MNGRFASLLAVGALGAVTMFGSTVTISLGSNPFPNGTEAPYVATVNGVANTTIYCDDEFDTVSTNESWSANTLTLNDLTSSDYTQTRFGTSAGSFAVATKLYEEAAYLALQFASNPMSDWAGIQTALWHVFDSSATTVGTSGPTSTSYWETQASNNYASVASIAAYIEILTPINGTQSKGGAPQEFLEILPGIPSGGTPEPGTYAMFGLGLVLLSVGTFRRRGNKTN